MIRDLTVLTLPVMTGLTGLLWAEMVSSKGGAWATASGAIAYILVAGILASVGGMSGPRPTVASFAILTALNAIVSTLWLLPMASGARYVSLALIEGAWPVFSILFAWILFKRFEVDEVSAIGGALIMVGAALVFHRS